MNDRVEQHEESGEASSVAMLGEARNRNGKANRSEWEFEVMNE